MVIGSFIMAAGLAIFDKILQLISRMFPDKKIIGIIYQKLHNMVYFSMMLRPLIEAYLNAVIGSLLALYFLSIDTKLNAAYSTLTIMINVIYVLFPILTFFFLRKFQKLMNKESFREKYESLYEGLKVSQDAAFGIYQVPFFLFRRLVLAFTIVCIQQFVALQLLIQSLVSLFYLRFLVEYKPYETYKMNALEIFNELTISSCFYISYLFTDYIPDVKRRYFVGWLLTFLVLFNVFVNFVGIIVSTFLALKEAIKKWRKRKASQTKVVPFKSLELTKSQELLKESVSSPSHADTQLMSNVLPQKAQVNFMHTFGIQPTSLDDMTIEELKQGEEFGKSSGLVVSSQWKQLAEERYKRPNKVSPFNKAIKA